MLVKYRHGNVTVKTQGTMSFALVFRIVQRYELYDTLNNTLITNNEKMKEKDKEKYIKRMALYETFDYTKYHTILKQMYCNMKSRIRHL